MVARRSRKKGKQPVGSHPLFPAMIALWFGALLGLGSLAIRPSLLESAVLALGIDLVVPAAAPPLGITARIVVALFCFAVGASAGFVCARRIAAGHAAAKASRVAAARMARRTSAQAVAVDVEAPSEPENAQATARRRGLAIEQDDSPQYHDRAPVPGSHPRILDLAELGSISEITLDSEAESDSVAEASVEAGEAVAVVETAAVQEAGSETEGQAEVVSEVPEQTAFDPWQRHAPPSEPVEANEEPEIAQTAFGPPRAFDAGALAPEIADAVAEAATAATSVDAEESPGPVARPFGGPVDASEPEPVLSPEGAQVELVASLAPHRAGSAARSAAEKLTAAPLDSLGVVQLAERLALAIARRKAGSDAGPVAIPRFEAPVSHPVPQPVCDPAPEPEFLPESGSEPAVAVATAPEPDSEPAVEAEAETEIAPAAIPAALRPLCFEDEDDDGALESLVPPRRFVMQPAPAPVLTEPGPAPDPVPEPADAQAPDLVGRALDEDAGAQDDGYGSLIGMKLPARQTFARIEDEGAESGEIEPVVVFPGQARRIAPFAAPEQAVEAAPEIAPASPPARSDGGRAFDAQPVQATAAKGVDPEETERALKAALATLQRMSGAA